MKQTIRLSEEQFNNLVKESVKTVLYEGFGEKFKNFFNKKQKEPEQKKTYNQTHLYKYGEHPEYMSQDFKDMYDLSDKHVRMHRDPSKGPYEYADDYDVIGFVQRSVGNLGGIIAGKINPFEPAARYPWETKGEYYLIMAERDLKQAQRFNLDNYVEYLSQLIQQVKEIMSKGK